MSAVINRENNNSPNGRKMPDDRHGDPTPKEALSKNPVPVQRQRPKDNGD